MKKWLFQFSLLRHECNYLFCMSTYFFKSYWIESTPSILEVTPCDWQLKRATVFYYSICTIKSTFLLKPVFTLHVIEHLFHLLKCNVSQKKKSGRGQLEKIARLKRFFRKKKKITSFSKAYFIKNNFATLKISTGFLSSEVVCGHITQKNKERPTFSLK